MSHASSPYFSALNRSGLLTAVIGGHLALFALFMAAKTVAPQIMAELPLIVDLLPAAAPAPAPEEPAARPFPIASPPPSAPKQKPRPTPRPAPKAAPPPPAPAELETTISALPSDDAPVASSEAVKAPPSPRGGASTALPGAGTGDPDSPARFDADYLKNPAPPYPPLSRKMREEGKVILRVLVTPGGSAGSVEIKTSSGSQRLDESALRTVRNWKFIPAKRGDTPVESRVLVPIIFKLEF